MSTTITQTIFNWALAYKREDSGYPVSIKKLADSMSEEEIEKYSTAEILPNNIAESIADFIIEMDFDELDILEKDSKTEVTVKELKPSDELIKDVKTPAPTVPNPEVPPGYVKADTRKDPGFFTPSLFKRPGDKTAKRETRTMDFQEFLKRINYRTHDDVLQKGHGQNLTGK